MITNPKKLTLFFRQKAEQEQVWHLQPGARFEGIHPEWNQFPLRRRRFQAALLEAWI